MSEKIVVGYVRVSTENQAREGVSLDQQRSKIRAYCAAFDLTLLEICADEGVSAKDLNRPGIQRALMLLRGGKAKGLVLTKLDRLTRSLKDLTTLAAEVFCAGRSELISVTDAIDTRSAAGRLTLNVMGSVAQWEREVTSERTKDSAHALAEEEGGWIWGAAPFGYQHGPRDSKGRKTLIPHPEEQETIELIRRWAVEEKLSIGKIIDRLHALGRPAKGGPRWWPRTVLVVMRRAGIPRSAVCPPERMPPRAPGGPKRKCPLGRWPEAYGLPPRQRGKAG